MRSKRSPAVIFPAFMAGKGPDFYLLRETYYICQLRKYIDNLEKKLIKKRAAQLVRDTEKPRE